MKTISFAFLSLALLITPAQAQPWDDDVILAPAPIMPYSWLVPDEAQRLPTKAVAVDSGSRSAVASFYQDVFLPALSVPAGWTGNVASCIAGVTSQAYLDATIDMVNYYRGMAGLPSITNDTTRNDDTQEAALMMIAEGSLDHTPPDTWACYTTTGATGASGSNLALGRHGPNAIVAYVADSGGGNFPVGHRRWILHPRQVMMGTGSNDALNGFYRGANALWIFSAFGTRPAEPAVVAWPPPGFVPYQVVYSRWSMSLSSAPGANFLSAVVTMTENGVGIPLTVVSRIDNGYGDNTIVWEPSGLSFPGGQPDRTITVTVTNIGATTTSASYDVTVIDPAIMTGEIFTDGFESGNVTRWPAKVP